MNELYNFDAKKNKEALVKWIKDWFDKNGPTSKAVIGISGGKDSTVVAALCKEALGANRVLGVLMPNTKQIDEGPDFEISKDICNWLNIDYKVISIRDAFFNLSMSVAEAMPGISNQAMINLPARLRMVTLFAVAQTCDGRVSCNCNLSEDWIGYSTYGGDDFGSFSPLRNLTTDEVIAIGYELGLPKEFIEKVPTDGLCGVTDEERFGFSYATLNKYIRTKQCDDLLIKETIDSMYSKNTFKWKIRTDVYVPICN